METSLTEVEKKSLLKIVKKFRRQAKPNQTTWGHFIPYLRDRWAEWKTLRGDDVFPYLNALLDEITRADAMADRARNYEYK